MKKAGQKAILFFNSNKAWGGGEKWHFEIASALAHQGYKIFMVCHKNGQLIKESKYSEYACIGIKVNNLSIVNIFKVKRFSFWIRKNNIDSIILNLPSDLKFAGLAAYLAKVPRIIYRRGSAIPIKNSILNRILFRKVVSDILVNSEETRKTILGNNKNLFDINKIHLIYNGIRLDEYDTRNCMPFYQKKGDEFVIGNAARMVHQKGQEDLIQIALMLKRSGIQFKMLIAGEGTLKEKLRSLTITNGLSDYIEFPGFIGNIKAFMESIDVFVLPSRWEGFGYVLAEAMASSKPIVAYNVSSNPELIINKENGFLIEMGNITEFYNKTILLLNDPDLRKKYGNKGRMIVSKKFDFSKNLDSLKKWLQI